MKDVCYSVIGNTYKSLCVLSKTDVGWLLKAHLYEDVKCALTSFLHLDNNTKQMSKNGEANVN